MVLHFATAARAGSTSRCPGSMLSTQQAPAIGSPPFYCMLYHPTYSSAANRRDVERFGARSIGRNVWLRSAAWVSAQRPFGRYLRGRYLTRHPGLVPRNSLPVSTLGGCGRAKSARHAGRVLL